MADMRDHFQQEKIDLLEAHSFLWTLGSDIVGKEEEKRKKEKEKRKKELEKEELEKKFEKAGTVVFHKEYGQGTISKLTEEDVYVAFGSKKRIFPKDDAKKYLTLVSDMKAGLLSAVSFRVQPGCMAI